MPVLAVDCQVRGFDPAATPIHWRLQIRHALCRHQPQGNYHYRGACEILDAEWQGKSRAGSFRLFETADSLDLDYDYNDNTPDTVVMGGNAILTVAAMPPGCPTVLRDYAHLRIGGTNPSQAEVVTHVNRMLQARNPNLPHMLNAIFTHENSFRQFASHPQRSTHMRFRQKHHHNDATQPDCNVLFDWPDDPESFPSVSFDWGVGISQYTKTLGITVGAAASWDWRYNVRTGINEFLGKLRHQSHANLTWRQWAHRAWRAYNGSGPQAEAYADALEALPDGQAVSTLPVPADLDVNALTAALPEAPSLGVAPEWPPFLPPGDYNPASRETLPA